MNAGIPRRKFILTLATLFMAFCISSVCSRAVASDETPNKTPADVFDGMRKSFRSDKAQGVHARYQWNISGPDGGGWWIVVTDGKCEMGKGKIGNADVTFEVSDQDWVAISNGKLGGTWAYVSGRLKINGPQSIAKKLDAMFP
jgi:putative sterol carrier protein